MPRQLQRNLKDPNKLYHTPVSNYLAAKSFRDNRLWKLLGHSLVTEVNGEFLTAKEFDEKYPVPSPISFNRNPENPDKTKDFLL